MAPKKNKLTSEQQATYNQVLKNLHNEGVLDQALGADPVTKRRKTGKKPHDAELAEASTTAASESASANDGPTSSPSEAAPKPTATKAPKAKPAQKAATKKKEPVEEPPEPAAKSKRAKIGKETEAPSATAATPASAAAAQANSFYDEGLDMQVSWANWDKVLAAIQKKFPGQEPWVVAATLETEIGPPPAELGIPTKPEPTSHKVPAADEDHPGPILEDTTLDQEAEESEQGGDDDEEVDLEEEEDSDEEEELKGKGKGKAKGKSKCTSKEASKGKGKASVAAAKPEALPPATPKAKPAVAAPRQEQLYARVSSGFIQCIC